MSDRDDAADASATRWRHVIVAFGAGCLVAVQVGKVPAALPLLGDELRLSLFEAGWVVSLLNLMTASVGMLVGLSADRAGRLRAAVAGLLLCGAGGLYGAFGANLSQLLAGRVLEGVGLMLAAVSLPGLIASVSAPRDRPLTLALWGAFMPAGMGLMLLLSPWLLAALGWRGVWFGSGAAILLFAAVLYPTFRALPLAPAAPRPAGAHFAAGAFGVGPLLLAGCFFAYSMQFQAVTAFLPTLLIDSYGLTIAAAATLTALAVLGNIAGNLAAGWLLRAGVGARALLTLAALLMGLSSCALFSSLLPLGARAAAAFAFTTGGGLIPGCLFASAPAHAPDARYIGAVVGLMFQGSGVGQLLGPPLLGLTVGAFGGWDYAAILTLTAALFGASCGWLLPGRR